jgi:hypothetical protein
MVQVLSGRLDEDFVNAKERRRNDFGDFWRLD